MAKPKPQAEDPQAPKKSYKALGNVKHDGDDYKKGEVIDLTDKQAKPLIARKVVEPVTK